MPYLTTMILRMTEPHCANWSQWNKRRHSLTACPRVGQHHVWEYVTATHRRTYQQWSFHFQLFEQCCEKTIFIWFTQCNVFAFSPPCTTHITTSYNSYIKNMIRYLHQQKTVLTTAIQFVQHNVSKQLNISSRQTLIILHTHNSSFLKFI